MLKYTAHFKILQYLKYSSDTSLINMIKVPTVVNGDFDEKEIKVKAYWQRWIILFIFILYAAINSYQWIEYSIITNIITKYYQVDSEAVNWTSMIYMALYAPLCLPASYVIDKKGLRVAGLIGCFGTLLGTAIKVLSVRRDLFFVVLIGQAIVSASQVVIICLPTKIAAVWFKPSEISTASSLGVFGTQLGCSIGFVLSPVLVRDHQQMDDIATDLRVMCWSLTIAMLLPSLLILIYFPKQPKYAPSITQAKERHEGKETTFKDFIKSLKILFRNKALIIHAVAYGINIAVFSAVGTVLNEIIIPTFKDAAVAGKMGLVMVLVGMFGSIGFGFLLDKTRKYKEINVAIYFASALSLVAIMYCLEMESEVLVYISMALVGLFTNGYMLTGFELAIELTFPAEESTTSSIILAGSQIMGVFCAMFMAKVNRRWGSFWAIGSQALFLFIGAVITMLIPNKLKRQEAFKAEFNGTNYQGVDVEENLPIKK